MRTRSVAPSGRVIFRRLRMYRIVAGTSEIQRNTVAKGVLQGRA
ncbi:acyl-CoA dehydrogenase family protein [Ramlibacter sp. AN1015]